MRVCGQMTEFSTRARSSTKHPWPRTELMICAPGLIWQSSPMIESSSISATVAESNRSAAFLDVNPADAIRQQVVMGLQITFRRADVDPVSARRNVRIESFFSFQQIRKQAVFE